MKDRKKIKSSESPRTKKPTDGVGTRVPVENPKGPTGNNTSNDVKPKS